MESSPQSIEILDGYGIPFDPIRYLRFLHEGAVAAEALVFDNPSLSLPPPIYITPKDKPAGWWDKTLSDSETRSGV